MSYLKIPLTPAVNGQNYLIIPKDKISWIRSGDGSNPPTAGATLATRSTIFLSDVGGLGENAITLTHTAAAAGFSVSDSINDALASNPGGIVSLVGGVPATVSVTAPGVIGGQALTFVNFTAWVVS
tara:strand:- start:282 stop:659 length:378 start_codon:yes stop_codon:yes gene_type:complete